MPPILQFLGGRSKIKSNAKGIEKKRGKMSGTVNYPKVIDQLTDVIKELNVGFAPCGAAAPAAPSEETRRADAVGLLKALLSTLEQTGGPAAAAEHASASTGKLGQFEIYPGNGSLLVNGRNMGHTSQYIYGNYGTTNSNMAQLRNWISDKPEGNLRSI